MTEDDSAMQRGTMLSPVVGLWSAIMDTFTDLFSMGTAGAETGA